MRLKKWVKLPWVQVILFVILVILLFISFLRIEDTIKLVGLPFQIIPNTLGLTRAVAKDEVKAFEITANSEVDVLIDQPGDYYIFMRLFGGYKYYLGIEIKSPQGEKIILSGWYKRGRLYDTIHASGMPVYQFYVEEPGTYQIFFIPESYISPKKKFEISIVPDYISGRENIYRNAYIIQIIILLAIGSMIYYYKIGKAANKKRKNKKSLGDKKRNQMDDFMKNNYKK